MRAGIQDLFEPSVETTAFREDILSGLQASPKQTPCKYLYDEEGARLFEAICDTYEYYVTRTELQIMEQYAGDIAQCFGPHSLLVEYGSGSGRKSRLLLGALDRLAAYLPVDISRRQLHQTVLRLRRDFPLLFIDPICADFAGDFRLPAKLPYFQRKVVYFPGSTIGNFSQAAAVRLLRKISSHCVAGDALLIGIDLLKDKHVLLNAYNDAQGFTAQFNRNLLVRANRELDADFDLNAFRHQAIFNPFHQRMEMHLISLRGQLVHVAGEAIPFYQGESIHTESSHKYAISQFSLMAQQASFDLQKKWVDDRHYFAVLLFVKKS